MKTIVIYDSKYGNTEMIAKAISEICGAKLAHVNNLKTPDIENVELLIVGSPTQGGRPTENIQKLINATKDLGSTRVAAFDTRLKSKWVGIFGNAASKIADKLQSVNGKLILSPEGFLVSGEKGPLVNGEIDRSKEWAKRVIAQS